MNNSTSTTTSTQEVTGQSAFWVLITLAVAAVCQPTHTRVDSVLFGGSISLARAFPGVCLWDGISDAYTLYKAICERRATRCQDVLPVTQPRPAPDGSISVRLTPNVVMVKLTIAFIAVLPQTIKIFSMRDIPWTQFAAAIFFFASTMRLIVELSGLENNRFDLFEKNEVTERGTPVSFLACLVLIGQFCSWVWIWYNISFLINIDLSGHTSLPAVGLLIISIIIITTVANFIIRYRGTVIHLDNSKPVAPKLESGISLLLIMPFNCLTKPPDDGLNASTIAKGSAKLWRLIFAFLLIFYSILLCLSFCSLLDFLGRKIAERNSGQDLILEREEVATSEPQEREEHPPRRMKDAATQTEEVQEQDSSIVNLTMSHDLTPGREGAAPSEPRAKDETPAGQIANAATHIEPQSGIDNQYLSQRIKKAFTHLLRSVVYRIHVINSILDRQSMAFIRMNSAASNIIAFTMVNLVTTVCYYLVRFDGSGTTSPAWTSVLG